MSRPRPCLMMPPAFSLVRRGMSSPPVPPAMISGEPLRVDELGQHLQALHDARTRPLNQIRIDDVDMALLDGGNLAPSSTLRHLRGVTAVLPVLRQDDHLWVSGNDTLFADLR